MAKKKSTETAAPTGENTFTCNGKTYKAIKPADVPMANGTQRMTAADIAVSTEAQEYLVKNGCSCIEEVI